MRYPKLNPIPSYTRTVDVFGGYNRTPVPGAGEFYDMKNLSSDLYPLLSPRQKRGFYRKPASPQGLIALEQVCYVDGSAFVIGDERVEMDLSVAAQDCPKRLTAMGAYVIILPDRMYINTRNTQDRGCLDALFTGQAELSLCTAEGAAVEAATGETAPENPENLAYWLDTATKTLKQYDAALDAWVEVIAPCVKAASSDIGRDFAAGDGVTVTGVPELSGRRRILRAEQDFLVLEGLATGTKEISISRKMPAVDFLTESGNRLWGCRYGDDGTGRFVNEIYACKLGDFKNWNCFAGLSTDSYAAACGTDGPFTGAVTYLGAPLFFKEAFVHRVYGSVPRNFQIQATACRGVQPGCGRSLAIVGETLFYKARAGICAFDGSLPVLISEPLGTQSYSDAVAGSSGSKYYVSMKDTAEQYHLFVFDVARRLWHREDELRADAFCTCRGQVYCIDADRRNIITLFGGTEEQVSWMAQTGDIRCAEGHRGYLSRLVLRLWADKDARVEVSVRYDSRGDFEHLCTVFGTQLDSFCIPLQPRRCDHLRLQLEGVGDVRLYSIRKIMEGGSDQP